MNRSTTVSNPAGQWLLFALLAFVMLATRMDHFGSAVQLPDASVALFFFAGLVLHADFRVGRLAFAALCVLAAAIDYVAIHYQGASSYCVTPAYGFLLPAYFAMWWAGRQGALRPHHTSADWLHLTLLGSFGVSLAFLISNGSFYLFSGYVTAPSVMDYFAGVTLYFPRYALYSLGYIAIGIVVRALLIAVARKGVLHHG